MINFPRSTLFEYVFHELWLSGCDWETGSDRRFTFYSSMLYVRSCFSFSSVKWAESPQAIALLRQRQMREVMEVCTMSGARDGEHGRQWMCWRMMLELFSVEAFYHQFGQCLTKIYNVLFRMGHILCSKEILIGNLEFKSEHMWNKHSCVLARYNLD